MPISGSVPVYVPTQLASDSSTKPASTAFVKANISSSPVRTQVIDVNYTILPTDKLVVITNLSAPRVLQLPSANAFATGVILTVVDESGACSSTNTLTINVASGSDTINSQNSFTISSPYGFVALESNSSSKWTVVNKSTLSLAQQNSNNVLITGGIITGTAIASPSATITGGTIDNVNIGTTTPASASVISLNNGQLAGIRNRIMNGTGVIAQRGSTQSATMPVSSGAVLFFSGTDRWLAYAQLKTSISNLNVLSGTITSSLYGNGSNSNGSIINISVPTVSGTSDITPDSGNFLGFMQKIESYDIADLAGSTVTLSFFGTATATGGIGNGTIVVGTPSTVDDYTTTVTYNTVGSFNVNGSSANTKQIITFTLPSNAINGCVIFIRLSFPSATNNIAFNMGNVQLESGSFATPFEVIPISLNYSKCLRYLCIQQANSRFYAAGGDSAADSTISFPSLMRIPPSSSLFIIGSRVNLKIAPTINNISRRGARFEIISQAAGDFYAINEFYQFSAEL